MADSTDALTSPTVNKGTKREADLDDVSPTKLKALKAARNGTNGGRGAVEDESSNHKNGDEHVNDEDDEDDDVVDGEQEGDDYDDEDASDDDYDDDENGENGEEEEENSKASAGKSNPRRAAAVAAAAAAASGANESGDEDEEDEEDDGDELMGSRTHGVACSQSPDVTKFETPDHRRFSADVRSCMLNGPTSGLPQQNTEFTYQPVGFGESVRFPEVLQGQEMSQAVPFFQGTTFDARTQNGRVGSFNYVRVSATPSGLSAATQGYSLPQFTLSAAKVSSPSSVLMFNQATVPQLELEGRTIHKGAYGNQCAPLEMLREAETWPSVQRQMPSEAGCHQFDTGKASAPVNVAEPGSATREVGRSSCMLFGFSLTEKVLGADKEGAKEGNNEADCQNPRVLELFGHSHSTPSALHALCAAPLGT